MFKFNLQRFALTLPDAPSTSTATVGKDYLLYICTGSSYTDPTWTLIGGQRGASTSMSADEIDVSDKTTGGWKSTLPGLRSWSIDLDGLMLLNDDGVEAMEYAFLNGKTVFVKLEYPNGRYKTGWAAITDWSNETPHDGEASLSGTLSGNGALSELLGYDVSPDTATMSIASPANKTFTFTPSTGVVASIKQGSTTVDSANYTASTGSLIINGTYLATLSAGEYTFTLTFSDESTNTITITITA